MEFNNHAYVNSEESKIDQVEPLLRLVSKKAPATQGNNEKIKLKIKIYDFLGKPWRFAPPEASTPVNEVNKMRMFQMSKNNKFFIFNDSITNKICVYELIFQEKKFDFVLVYELQISKSFLFQHMYTIHIPPIEFFYKNRSFMKIDDSGQVKMCYVQNLPFVEDGGGVENEQNSGVQMV